MNAWGRKRRQYNLDNSRVTWCLCLHGLKMNLNIYYSPIFVFEKTFFKYVDVGVGVGVGVDVLQQGLHVILCTSRRDYDEPVLPNMIFLKRGYGLLS